MDRTKLKIAIPIETGSSEPYPRNTLIIPQKCTACGFRNFNIWGTTIDDNMRIEAICMRCGRTAYSLKYDLTS